MKDGRFICTFDTSTINHTHMTCNIWSFMTSITMRFYWSYFENYLEGHPTPSNIAHKRNAADKP